MERISYILCVGQIVYIIYTLLVYIYTLLVYMCNHFFFYGGVRFQILYIIFSLVGIKRGVVFISDFKKWIMYTFMAHPSGWDIKYT